MSTPQKRDRTTGCRCGRGGSARLPTASPRSYAAVFRAGMNAGGGSARRRHTLTGTVRSGYHRRGELGRTDAGRGFSRPHCAHTATTPAAPRAGCNTCAVSTDYSNAADAGPSSNAVTRSDVEVGRQWFARVEPPVGGCDYDRCRVLSPPRRDRPAAACRLTT